MEQTYLYLWGRNKGRHCTVVARSSQGRAVLVVFSDGERKVCSVHALHCIEEETHEATQPIAR